MSVLPVVAWPDPRLSRKCDPVGNLNDEIRQLSQDMLDTMYRANGRGLAAPQIGVLKRIFVMDATWKTGAKTPLVCIDPEFTVLGDAQSTNEEACLSIIGVSADVTRAQQIELNFTALDGSRETMLLDGFEAICAQHEIDHLNGRVIFDHLDEATRVKLEADYEALQT
ncbi:peptide deformylase [Planktotalea sp.]|uniref:peptide deformylase n=1 Tax=Planktotalea sp. TaxID=2029877 RepID=UPI003299842C